MLNFDLVELEFPPENPGTTIAHCEEDARFLC